MSKFIEKRKNIRIVPNSSLYVIFPYCANKLHPVVDISEKGIAVTCTDQNHKEKQRVRLKNILKKKGKSCLDIIAPDIGFSIERMPYRIISDSQVNTSEDDASIRRSIQFCNLSEYQAYWLSYLVNTNSSVDFQGDRLYVVPEKKEARASLV